MSDKTYLPTGPVPSPTKGTSDQVKLICFFKKNRMTVIRMRKFYLHHTRYAGGKIINGFMPTTKHFVVVRLEGLANDELKY